MKKIFLLILLSCTICNAEIKSSDVVFISLTGDNIVELDSYPITRDRFAILIDRLYEYYSPEMLFFDLIIGIPSKETPSLDKKLFDSIENKDTVYFSASLSSKFNNFNGYAPHEYAKKCQSSSYLRKRFGIFPLAEIISKGGKFAFVTVYPNRNGYYNKYPTIVISNETPFCSAPFLLALKYCKVRSNDIRYSNDLIAIDNKKLPVDKYGQYEINYNYKFDDVDYLSVINKKVDKTKINGKIIIFRNMLLANADHLPTNKSLKTNGSYILACATQTLIDLIKKR